MVMSSSSSKPKALYQRIADYVRAQIVDGTLQPGAKLPTEAELAERFQTTRVTVGRGLSLLINEGLVVPDRPRGHFVRQRRPMVYRPQQEFRKRPLSLEMDSFMAQMTDEGREASQKIEVAIVKPPADVRERLQLGPDDLTAVRRRVRYVDGAPSNTNDSYFPLPLVQNSEIMHPDDIKRGANQVLAELGYEQTMALDEFHIRMPTPEQAERLAIGPGTPVAVHLITGFTAAGRPVRAVINCLPGDRTVIAYERHRSRLGSHLVIKKAEESDLDTVIQLWEHAAAWLKDRGIEQWGYPPRVERIKANIARGECFLVWDDGVPVATMTVDEFADPDFWSEEEAREPAFYVHRMAVRRDASGQELGSALLDWASERATEHGKQWLRLDAWRTNNGLQDYYRARGFEPLRTVEVEGRGSGALFQRPAGVVRQVGPILYTDPEADDGDIHESI